MKKLILSLIFVVSLILTSANYAPATAWQDCGASYTVQRGDTLASIARDCGYTLTEVRNLNPSLGNLIYPGQIVYFYQQANQGYSGGYYYTVQSGDTLFKIATRHGITTDQLLVNNNIWNRNTIYAGQVLFVPGYDVGYITPPSDAWQPPTYQQPIVNYSSYTVQRGETLRILANRWGVSVYELLRLNPEIYNADILYAGQTINTPFYQQEPGSDYYVVQRGNTLKEIAGYYGIALYDLMLLNPSIWNPNLIYVGTSIRIR